MAIVLVGHGPSAGSCPLSIDDHTVIRLLTAGYDKPGRHLPHPGTRTDITVSTVARYEPDWLLQGDLMVFCRAALAPFGPRNPKPSTGLCAALIARDRHTKKDIYVTGFDWTLNPEQAVNYRHDAYAENACFRTLGIGVFHG